jgi:hypothetical protein
MPHTNSTELGTCADTAIDEENQFAVNKIIQRFHQQVVSSEKE